MDDKKKNCLACETQIKPGQEYETIMTRGPVVYRHIDHKDCSQALNFPWHPSLFASHGMVSC